jgi:cytochrome P450
VQRLAAEPQLQEELRRDRARIGDFVEEMLRLESPSKVSFRMASKSTTLAGVPIPAGSTILVLLGAADRDPERFECPAEFRLGRSNVRQHMAFGRGVHSCPGGPLVRAEANMTIERLLERLDDITISVAEHGPATARRWTYIPSYILRGVQALHLEFAPRVGT